MMQVILNKICEIVNLKSLIFRWLFSEYLVFMARAIKSMIKRFEQINDFFDKTIAVINASVYKNHNRFRNDKAFKGLKMITKKWSRLQNIKLVSKLQKFLSMLPLVVDLKDPSKSLHLPSMSMLEHLLVTFVSCFELAKKLMGLCEYTNRHFLARINLGHFWNWAVFSSASTSRVW